MMGRRLASPAGGDGHGGEFVQWRGFVIPVIFVECGDAEASRDLAADLGF